MIGRIVLAICLFSNIVLFVVIFYLLKNDKENIKDVVTMIFQAMTLFLGFLYFFERLKYDKLQIELKDTRNFWSDLFDIYFNLIRTINTVSSGTIDRLDVLVEKILIFEKDRDLILSYLEVISDRKLLYNDEYEFIFRLISDFEYQYSSIKAIGEYNRCDHQKYRLSLPPEKDTFSKNIFKRKIN